MTIMEYDRWSIGKPRSNGGYWAAQAALVGEGAKRKGR
jgi:hypothetical protein